MTDMIELYLSTPDGVTIQENEDPYFPFGLTMEGEALDGNGETAGMIKLSVVMTPSEVLRLRAQFDALPDDALRVNRAAE